jgi:hypothetical protein
MSILSVFESIGVALVETAAEDAPIFVHSPQGVLILNASENLLTNILQQFQAKTPITTTTVITPAPTSQATLNSPRTNAMA